MSSPAGDETRVQGVVACLVEAAGFSDRLAVEERARADWPQDAPPEEAALVSAARPEVRAAFAAGRACARVALARLGAPPEPLLRAVSASGDAARAPAWPAGFVGSLSHAGAHCAAVVARRSDFVSVGLDLEAPSRMTAKLLRRICTDREWTDVEAGGDLAHGALQFCAKEAFYKAWSPITARSIGFRDVEVARTGEGRFEIGLEADVEPGDLGPGPYEGLYARQGDLCVAIVVVPVG